MSLKNIFDERFPNILSVALCKRLQPGQRLVNILLPKLLCRFRYRTWQNVAMGLRPWRKMTWCTQNITSSYFTLWSFYISYFILFPVFLLLYVTINMKLTKYTLITPNLVPKFTLLSVSLRPWGRVGKEPGNEVESHLLTLPLPSSINPHFQNEAKCTTFSCENKFYLDENEKSFPYQRLST